MACKLCGKEKKIYKAMCCFDCYKYHVEKIYKLKEFIRFSSFKQRELINYFLVNQEKSKKELADFFDVKIGFVYYAIKKCCDEIYIRKDNKEFICLKN